MRDYRDYEMDEREMYDERNMPRDERGRYTSSRGGRSRDYEMGDERKSDYEIYIIIAFSFIKSHLLAYSIPEFFIIKHSFAVRHLYKEERLD